MHGDRLFIKIYTNMTHSHTCESHVDLNYSCRIASHFLRRELALHLTSHHRSRQCERSERRAHLPSLTFCRRLARRCQAHLSTSRTWSLFEFTLLSLKRKEEEEDQNGERGELWPFTRRFCRFSLANTVIYFMCNICCFLGKIPSLFHNFFRVISWKKCWYLW